eukprot:CAMPEP_0202960076 /NCGR_PEP_ID=MMETSP1396-20130829/4246_1 /ASSEMBLY_ACC=CAM_ASM_000872 /TAXON_ID= /ORGANISM="Pseudokeronopsis sp., Strain Brazil" /LENGTH=57 /DNA_ID=CAMNT_0049679057 /DNA_START=577 /DNA_END=750 /DNA_ORIENTATION=-
MKNADLIIPFNKPNPGGVDFVITFLKMKLRKYWKQSGSKEQSDKKEDKKEDKLEVEK